MIECDINFVDYIIPVGELLSASLDSLRGLECFVHKVDSVSVEEKTFVVPGIDFIELEFDSDLVVGWEGDLFD
jgi:hypothetical protein